MAFLRVKKTRGRPYAYLVENVWDPVRGGPRQRVLAYLGRLDRVRPEQLPGKPPKAEILRSLLEKQASARERVDAAARRHRVRLTRALVRGDPEQVDAVAREAIRALGEEEFLHGVLTGAMHEVGRQWAFHRVSISQEHRATSMLVGLVLRLHDPARWKKGSGPEVIVCVPEGEYHTLPLLLAERPLREKGYRVVNIGASAPSESTVAYVRGRRPAGVLISVTQPACREGAIALARRLRTEFPRLRIAVGGQALQRSSPPVEFRNVDVCQGTLGEYLSGWPSARTSDTPLPSSRHGRRVPPARERGDFSKVASAGGVSAAR